MEGEGREEGAGEQGTALLFRRRRRPWPPPRPSSVLPPSSLRPSAARRRPLCVVRCCLVSLGEGESAGTEGRREGARLDAIGGSCV